MRFSVALPVVVGLALLAVAAPARADVHVTMHDGLVSVNAKDATIRQILAEWAKVGQTRFVNADQIVGGPITLQLTDVPETQALDIILRSVSGYLAAPRPTMISNASRFDRVLVMPTPAAPPSRSNASFTPPPFSQPRPGFGPGVAGGPGNDEQNSDDSRNAPPPAPPLSQQRGPVFNTFASPTAPQGGGAGAPAPLPPMAPGASGTLGGASTPGIIVQPPQQPGQVTPPGPVTAAPTPG